MDRFWRLMYVSQDDESAKKALKSEKIRTKIDKNLGQAWLVSLPAQSQSKLSTVQLKFGKIAVGFLTWSTL